MEPLTLNESKRLIALEKEFAGIQKSWLRGSEILLEIHDAKLYRIEFKTFREYCEKKWGISDRHARNLIDAGQVVKNLPKSGRAVPLSQSAALELKNVPQEEREFVLEDATGASGSPPAAPAIKAAVRRSKGTIGPPAAFLDEPEHRETQDALVDSVAECERLTRENNALSATDQGAQIAKLNDECGRLRGRIDQLMTENKEAIKQAKYFQRICDRLRELLGVAKASEIYAAVELRKA